MENDIWQIKSESDTDRVWVRMVDGVEAEHFYEFFTPPRWNPNDPPPPAAVLPFENEDQADDEPDEKPAVGRYKVAAIAGTGAAAGAGVVALLRALGVL